MLLEHWYLCWWVIYSVTSSFNPLQLRFQHVRHSKKLSENPENYIPFLGVVQIHAHTKSQKICKPIETRFNTFLSFVGASSLAVAVAFILSRYTYAQSNEAAIKITTSITNRTATLLADRKKGYINVPIHSNYVSGNLPYKNVGKRKGQNNTFFRIC